MRFNRERVRQNVEQATTEDLLDRVTVYRPGMEPQAVWMIEEELRERGVFATDIDAHAARRAGVLLAWPDGPALSCSFCTAPAVAERWDWHRLWGTVPVFPRRFRYCSRHHPGG